MNQPTVIRLKDGASAEAHDRVFDGLPVPAGLTINEVLAYWNREALDALSWSGSLDYRCYLQEFGPCGAYADSQHDPACWRVNVTHPLLVAKYLESPMVGTFYDRSVNRRNRYRGFPARSLKRFTVTQEDRMALLTRSSFEARTQPQADEARTKFAEATRSSAFNLSLGIREIRLLAQRIWDLAIADDRWATINWMPAGDVAAFQRLIDKGLVIHERGKRPRLSHAGELMRALLVESNHIVEPAG